MFKATVATQNSVADSLKMVTTDLVDLVDLVEWGPDNTKPKLMNQELEMEPKTNMFVKVLRQARVGLLWGKFVERWGL